jgi:NADH-quinone oxidoreductase subunit L
MACLTASTVGIMFVSCGIGGYSLAILHFICHAFYKSMLFLSFAYVVSAMSNEKNILKMGGLSTLIPQINDAVWISFFSAVGFPFFVGFFSKISFASTLQLSDMQFLNVPCIAINILSIASIFRMILISMYGKFRSDEKTLSRIFMANKYDMTSLWYIIGSAVLGSFMAWSMYEWGALHFGSPGIVYARDFSDYFYENIAELSQILVSVILIWAILRFSKTKIGFGMTGILSSIFKTNEIYAFVMKVIKSIVIFLMHCFAEFNRRLSSFLSKYTLKSIYSSFYNLRQKHKRVLISHIMWILSGITLGIISMLFQER